jgi:hypothetical protein
MEKYKGDWMEDRMEKSANYAGHRCLDHDGGCDLFEDSGAVLN